jgi:hypothetical protein
MEALVKRRPSERERPEFVKGSGLMALELGSGPSIVGAELRSPAKDARE